MKNILFKLCGIFILLVMTALLIQCQHSEKSDVFPVADKFINPEARFKAYSGLGFNLKATNDSIAREQIQMYHKEGFGGVFIEAVQGNSSELPDWYVEQGKDFMKLTPGGITYLNDEYIQVYRSYLDEAKKLGMQVILYDDYHYPTGQVAGQFYQKYPELAAARLDKVEKDIEGEGTINLPIPEGTFLGAVKWDRETNQIDDISDLFKGQQIDVSVEKGKWKVMAFYLNHNAVREIRNPGIMNYLEKEATEKFISLSYEKFHKGFGEYFGNVIPMSFYDEPSLHWLDGKMWSKDLNVLYKERFGESPIKYYPALWYNIGENTAAARNAMHGLRAEMYAVNFVKFLNDWCKEHNLKLSGHMDQEEIVNPVMSNGDLMKVFEFQDIPGVDDIFQWGRSNPGYKIVTSASFNFDKPITWGETYAAYKTTDINVVYKVAMDQFAMGINMQTPFSGRLRKFMSKEDFIPFNNYVGRLSYMLQGGRHISDIAVLYPIASAQATNIFGEGWQYGYSGGIIAPELDYQVVGEDLFMGLRIDYTYLHPEVLDKRCIIKNNLLILNNEVNREEYKLFILPGGNTIHTNTAQKLLAYYRAGGKIIATTMLPFHSAEFGNDAIVLNAMQEIFNLTKEEILAKKINSQKAYTFNKNEKGGEAWFIPSATPDILEEVVDKCLPIRDVDFDEPRWKIGSFQPHKTGYHSNQQNWVDEETSGYKGALTYLHKVKSGKDIYFFANSSENNISTTVTLRGKMQLSAWNPHSGAQTEVSGNVLKKGNFKCTAFTLSLPTGQSVFIIGE